MIGRTLIGGLVLLLTVGTLRVLWSVLCTLTDPKLIEGVRYTLDRLREDYRELTGQAVMLEGCEG